jgi:hypothetical protein
MLNGSAKGRVQPQRKKSLAEVDAELQVTDNAIEIGNKLWQELYTEARAELGAERADDFKAATRQLMLCLIGAERAMQALDELAKGTDLQPYRLPGLGRLRNTGSAAYTALETAVRQGWISEKELQAELKSARAGD